MNLNFGFLKRWIRIWNSEIFWISPTKMWLPYRWQTFWNAIFVNKYGISRIMKIITGLLFLLHLKWFKRIYIAVCFYVLMNCGVESATKLYAECKKSSFTKLWKMFRSFCKWSFSCLRKRKFANAWWHHLSYGVRVCGVLYWVLPRDVLMHNVLSTKWNTQTTKINKK